MMVPFGLFSRRRRRRQARDPPPAAGGGQPRGGAHRARPGPQRGDKIEPLYDQRRQSISQDAVFEKSTNYQRHYAEATQQNCRQMATETKQI